MSIKFYAVLRWLLALTWTITFSILLLQPEHQAVVNTVIEPAPPSFERELLFTSLHLILFAFTAWVWCFALYLSRREYVVLGALVCILVFYGASAEMLQSHIPGRSTQIWDMLANMMGIAIGISAWFIVQHYLAQLPRLFSHQLP